MTTPTPKTKKVHFYEVKILTAEGEQQIVPRKWKEYFEGWMDIHPKLSDRKVNGVFCEARERQAYALVELHKPLNPDYAGLINHDSGTVTEYLSKDDDQHEGTEFAHSSVAAFFAEGRFFALAQGNGLSSPRSNAVADFLNAVVPLDDASWKVTPIIDRGRMRELKNSEGVSAFSGRFTTHQDLLTDSSDQDVPSLGNYLNQLASHLQSELIVEVSIKLDKANRQSRSKRRLFKDFLTPSLERISDSPNAKATISREVETEHGLSMSDSEISLVTSQFVVAAEFEEDPTEAKRFSRLVDIVVETVMKNEARVKELY